MKVWSAVYLFGGIVSDMYVFSTKEAAKDYFDSIVNNEGGIEACDPDYYEDGNNDCEVFYWCDGDDSEVVIWRVEVEG